MVDLQRGELMSRNGRHKKAAHSARLSIWWAHTDLNRGPKDYESSALTN
jgi:hypothetical protein